MTEHAHTVIVVGAGFSGTVVAANILHASTTARLRVVLIERSPLPGRGVAYSTTSPRHLLNVPAGRMSAFVDDEDHFLRYAKERIPSTVGGSFVPRLVFADYLATTLDDAEREGAARGHRLERVYGEAVEVVPRDRSVQVRLASGVLVAGHHAVLAIGNYPPANPPVGDGAFYSSPRYVADPWAPGALSRIDADSPVLLVGTGLTMLDVVLQLADLPGGGAIHALSRRGLLPLPHRPHGAPPSYGHLPPALIACEPSASAYLRAIRAHVRDLARDGIDWREVMASLRPLTPRLWETLDETERRRFMRHARTYWDTHRHRVATEVWNRFEELRDAGRVTVHAGRIRAYEESDRGVTVRVRPRGGAVGETGASPQGKTLHVGAVINCTGPESDVRCVRDPLLTSLLQSGVARADAMGMGLDTDGRLALVSRDGAPSRSVWLVGPLLRGRYWEATAVPELRVHAARVAREVLQAPAATHVPNDAAGPVQGALPVSAG